MYPLDLMSNACRPVTLAGKQYPVRQLRLREWGELQAWLKSVAPSPVAVALKALAEVPDVPQPVQDALFRQAQDEARRWPPKVGSPAWINALEEIEGGRAMFLQAALAAGGTELDEEQADRIVDSATAGELGELLMICLFGEPSVPKGAGEATPPSPTTGDGSTSTSGQSAA